MQVKAQVMLVRNLSSSLVNGSRGVIVDFIHWNKVDEEHVSYSMDAASCGTYECFICVCVL